MSATQPSVSSFQSSDLNKAFGEVSDVFESHKATLDTVSQDIKNLEAYIRSKGVSIPFALDVEQPKGLAPNDCRLMWDKAGNGEMRLLYQEEFFDSNAYNLALFEYAEIGQPCFADRSEFVTVICKKPLIEAPLTVRLALAPFLPDFVRSLANRLRVEKPAPIDAPNLESLSY